MVFCSAGQFPEINVNERAFLVEANYNSVIALDVSNASVKTWQLCIFEAHLLSVQLRSQLSDELL